MKIAVLEHFTSCPTPAAPGLRAEGRAMRDAIVEDLLALPGVTVTVVHRDPSRLALSPGLSGRIVEGDRESLFRDAVRDAEAALVIAPEEGRLLEGLSRIVEEEKRLLLGPSAASVRLLGDKLATARALAAAGLPTPACEALPLASAAASLALRPLPFVVKPRDGCGGLGASLVRRRAEVPAAIRTARLATLRSDLLVQDYVPGSGASVPLIVGAGGSLALGLARQHLRGGGSFVYEGGEIPWPHALRPRAIALARAVAGALARAAPGLRGYVGVDLVVSRGGPHVIEVNPRLTSAYLGLRRVVRGNAAAWIIDAALGRPIPARIGTAGRCRFRGDGGFELVGADGRKRRPWSISDGISAASI